MMSKRWFNLVLAFGLVMAPSVVAQDTDGLMDEAEAMVAQRAKLVQVMVDKIFLNRPGSSRVVMKVSAVIGPTPLTCCNAAIPGYFSGISFSILFSMALICSVV